MQLTVLPNFTGSAAVSICQGESYSFNGNSYSVAGTYVDTLTSANGCDSVVTLELTVLPGATGSETASICEGESFQFNGNSYSVAGTYVDTLTAANGCDSVVTLELTVLPGATGSETASICQGDSFQFNGNSYSVAGTYVDTLTSANGCDSILQLQLIVLPMPEIDSVSVQHPTCGDTTGGIITIFAQGAGSNLLYSVDNGLTYSEQPVFFGLPPGAYAIVIKRTDAPFCTYSYSENPVTIDPAANCCPAVLVLDDTPIVPGEYKASDRILSAGHIAVGTEVIFSAGNEAELLPGFNVELGGIFEIKLEGCQP
jgi:hypothetical protein